MNSLSQFLSIYQPLIIISYNNYLLLAFHVSFYPHVSFVIFLSLSSCITLFLSVFRSLSLSTFNCISLSLSPSIYLSFHLGHNLYATVSFALALVHLSFSSFFYLFITLSFTNSTSFCYLWLGATGRVYGMQMCEVNCRAACGFVSAPGEGIWSTHMNDNLFLQLCSSAALQLCSSAALQLCSSVAL